MKLFTLILCLTAIIYMNCEASSLKEELLKLPVWRADRIFTSDEWDLYKNAYAKFKSSDSDQRSEAVSAVAKTMAKRDYKGLGEADSILYLFLRLVYDVDPKKISASKGWIGLIQRDSMWPLKITDGKAMVLSVYKGSRGAPYDVTREYQKMSRKFSFRPKFPEIANPAKSTF